MSQEIRRSSGPRSPRIDRKAGAKSRVTFLRLWEDVVDELHTAVNRRLIQGSSRAEIARKAGLDPAVLSRVLVGRSGTNLRTIAAVLNGSDHRLRIQAVPCEHMRRWGRVDLEDVGASLGSIDFSKSEGIWSYVVKRGSVGLELHGTKVQLNTAESNLTESSD